MLSQKIKEKICKIKKIKSDNFLSRYFIYKTFHDNYNSPNTNLNSPGIKYNINKKVFLSRLRNKNMKLFSEKSKSTNHLLSLNNEYLKYTPHVTKMMKTGIESTKYDSTKYTITQKEEIKDLKKNSNPKLFFGLPGDTPLIKNGTFTDLYSNTNYNTLSKINSLSEKNIFVNEKKLYLDKIIDNDRKTAGEFFMDSFRNNNLKMFSKKNRKDFYEKYNINNQLTIAEEIKINDIINRNKKNNIYLNSIFKSMNTEDSFDAPTHIYTSERQYKNPYDSCKEMKIKNQILKVMENLNINYQCEKFQKEYNNACELNTQKNQMRNLKIIPKKKLKIFKGFNAEHYLKNLNSNELSLEDNLNSRKKNKKAQIFFFHKPQTIYARGEDLNEVELKVEHFPCIYHPELRSKTAICFNEEKGQIFLFGGLEGKKLSDLWQFNFEQIKMGWKKIYEPNDYSDYVNEPLPRFGHTMHFYNDKIYLIGGEFTNWKMNELKEGIMCFYDVQKNTWDMMKYIYDFKWYNKKKQERKATLKNKILTFNEISKSLKNTNNNKNININQNELKETAINSLNKKYSKVINNQLIEKQILTLEKLNEKYNNRKSKINKENDKLKLTMRIKKYNNNINEIDESYIYPELRRYHISLLIGTHIFLYGGETPSNKCLNDCWIYDLINQKWSLLEYIGRYPPPLCCHSACLVLEQNQLINEALNVYYKPLSEQKTLHLLKSDGVFFFGGYNENKIPTNLFFKMEIGVKPVLFEIPKTKGMPPSPRIEATMNFNSENNLIVIHGGRNDLKNEVYNDIILLDMENMCWIHTKFWGEKPLHRSEHNAVVLSNKLFIFGGINNAKFINFDFTIFNLDFFAQKYALKNDI